MQEPYKIDWGSRFKKKQRINSIKPIIERIDRKWHNLIFRIFFFGSVGWGWLKAKAVSLDSLKFFFHRTACHIRNLNKYTHAYLLVGLLMDYFFFKNLYLFSLQIRFAAIHAQIHTFDSDQNIKTFNYQLPVCINTIIPLFKLY